jgi:hypothetical protein
MCRGLRADKPEPQFRPISNEHHVIAGLEVVFPHIECGNTHVDTFVDATENTMSYYLFHVLHYTPIVVY